MEKIKVVYSWIGPRGPIRNTELPNILGFASVAEQTSVSSRHWWAEGIWHTLFRHANNYEVYPAYSIAYNDPRTFILPFTLGWRVNFSHYFSGTDGILEFGHVPKHIIDAIRNKNGFILIDHSVEAFMSPNDVDALHSYFECLHHFPLHKVIYVTGCMNANDLYEDYCTRRNIPNNKESRLSIVTYPSSIDAFSQNFTLPNAMPAYYTNRVPDKLFLMWNRRIRKHRAELALNLELHGLIDRSYVSFSDIDREKPAIPQDQYLHVDYVMHRNPDITTEVVDRFKSKLPLVLDNAENIIEMCSDPGNKSRPFYQNSLISVVTETHFYETEVTLTEKSFKPMKEKHPFITVGVNGALKALQEIGFKTFSDFWDESYDAIPNPSQRLAKIIEILVEIGKWTPEQILDFRVKVKPILDHNYNLLNTPGSIHSLNKVNQIIGAV